MVILSTPSLHKAPPTLGVRVDADVNSDVSCPQVPS